MALLPELTPTLRAALSHAIKEELIIRNVAMNVTLPKRRRPTRRRQAWTTDEARAFLESARHNDRHYAAYVLILVLGLRKGGVLGLTWNDIDLDTSTLNIEHQLQRVGRQLLHRETKTEASDAEGIPLPDICTTALRLRRNQQQHDKATTGPVWQGDQLVFTTRYGTPIEPRNLNRA